MIRTRSSEAQDFLDRVGAELSDLPVDDRTDLLEELGAHLDDLESEDDTPLERRLGTPQEYAAELRASAGLPPTGASRRRAGVMRKTWRELRGHQVTSAVLGFLTVLRPLWWVVRAWVLVALVAMFPGQTTATWSGVLLVVPRISDGSVGLLVLMLTIIASVQLGRRGRQQHSAVRRAVLLLNVVAALALAPAVASLSHASQSASFGQELYFYDVRVPSEGVFSAGEQVWNIYPYDSAGRLLHDVRLYDQAGRPLDLMLAEDPTRRPVLDAYGKAVPHAYPLRYFEPGGTTVVNEDAAPRVIVPPLMATPAAPAPSPTPSGTGTR